MEGWILTIIAGVRNNRVSARQELTVVNIIFIIDIFMELTWLPPMKKIKIPQILNFHQPENNNHNTDYM